MAAMGGLSCRRRMLPQQRHLYNYHCNRRLQRQHHQHSYSTNGSSHQPHSRHDCSSRKRTMDGGRTVRERRRHVVTDPTVPHGEADIADNGDVDSGLSRVAPITDNTTDDNGLEYHIKFPAAKYKQLQSLPSGGQANVVHPHGEGEECVPVVLLFGWAGCQDKYLAKYSKIYEDRGLITLRYIVPIRYLLWKRYHVIHIGQKLVKLLYDLNFDGHPIIVHCFSNGGAFLYQNFSMALENSPTTIQIKGVIFDSSPGRRRLVSLYKAISAILGGNPIYNAAMSFLFTLFCSIIWLWEVAQKYVCSSRRDLVADPFDRLRSEPHLWPQHFIYSEADALISHKDVEKFIRHRESVGVRVTALRYKSSPHVKHFSAHKESYEASVLAFVNECLNSNGGDGDLGANNSSAPASTN